MIDEDRLKRRINRLEKSLTDSLSTGCRDSDASNKEIINGEFEDFRVLMGWEKPEQPNIKKLICPGAKPECVVRECSHATPHEKSAGCDAGCTMGIVGHCIDVQPMELYVCARHKECDILLCDHKRPHKHNSQCNKTCRGIRCACVKVKQ